MQIKCIGGFVFWSIAMQPQPRIHDKVGYHLLETLICNKLSERAEGKLHYQIWQHQDDQSFGISLCKNESTGGFSAELIQVADILQCLANLKATEKPFHATAFKPLFSGKSANNHCFLAAVFVDQKLIHPHAMTERLLEVDTDFESWVTRLEGLITTDKTTSSTTSSKKRPEKEIEHEVHQA